jgi:peptidoglycan DL-endopeptidase CwlO
MTRTNRTTTSRRRLVATGLVGATAALTVLAPGTAEARTRVASPDVAAVAAQAVDALDRWQASGSVIDYAAYLDLRSRAATLTASGMGMPGEALRVAWGSVRIEKQHALLAAVSQLGVPYRSMRSDEGVAFDCSGLMLYAWEAAGVDLPRSSGDQFRAAEEISEIAIEPGDFVFYPGHISMYVGFGLMVHSPNSGSEVEVRAIPERSLRFSDLFEDVEPAPASVGAGTMAARDQRSGAA